MIVVFHLVATGMELFKTAQGDQLLALSGSGGDQDRQCALFAGFMYSAVGSYLARVWRIFEFRYSNYLALALTALLAVLIYANFFTHHYIADIRWWLLAGSVFLFGRVWIYYRIDQQYRSMPLVLGFFLVALFIWFAENLATFANVWLYPSQKSGWTMVSWEKIVAWYLLMLISFVLVSLVQRPQGYEECQAS